MAQTWQDILDTPLKPGEHLLAVMQPYGSPDAGDQKITWDSTKPDEVAQTRETYDKWKKKGYVAYSVEPGGRKGTVLDKFDPDAECIIFALPLRGGC